MVFSRRRFAENGKEMYRDNKSTWRACKAALQAATILVAMASEKNIWRKILTNVANWRPTDYKRNLLGKFVTPSQELCSKSFRLPDIEISSFPLSRPLLKCFNRQARKRNNLAKERVAKVSLGVVEVHVTYTKCPPLDITAIINFFFWRPKFFYGDHFVIEGRQKATFWKSELGALLKGFFFVH